MHPDSKTSASAGVFSYTGVVRDNRESGLLSRSCGSVLSGSLWSIFRGGLGSYLLCPGGNLFRGQFFHHRLGLGARSPHKGGINKGSRFVGGAIAPLAFTTIFAAALRSVVRVPVFVLFRSENGAVSHGNPF
jgi:hypothetical protein